jgi:hypothetical protein
VAERLQRQRGGGEDPDGVAGPLRADRQAGVDEPFLGAVECRVQPRPEIGELARVAGQLAVDAVGDERDLQQDRTDVIVTWLGV